MRQLAHFIALLSAFGLTVSGPAGARQDFVDEWNVVPCVMFYPAVAAARRGGCTGDRIRFGSKGRVSYNKLGLPDRDYPPKAAPGVLRILLTGGSVWTGPGIDQEAAVPRQFEMELARLGVRQIEVINAATEGFSAWQNAILLPQYLEHYSPDLVLFHEFRLYPFQDLSELERINFGQDERPIRYSPWTDDLPASLREVVMGRSSLAILVSGVSVEWSRIRQSWKIAAHGSEEARIDALLQPTIRYLRVMKDAAESAGASFTAVLDGDPVSSEQLLVRGAHFYTLANLTRAVALRNFSFPSEAVRARLSREGIETLSLESTLPLRQGEGLTLQGDYHWSAEGARRYAAHLAQGAAPLLERARRRSP